MKMFDLIMLEQALYIRESESMVHRSKTVKENAYLMT